MNMMDCDKQFDIVVNRVEELRVRRRYINKIKASSVSLCVSAAFVLSVIFFMPGNGFGSVAVIGKHSGSMMIKGDIKAMIIGALSFVMGVFFTLLCINIRRLQKRSGKEDDR